MSAFREADPPARPGRAAIEVALIFLVFFIQAAWPAPEVNEPHYLAKARHYWNPSWCADDFLCQSADAHQVFYWTFGWLSRWLSLPALAWVGRVATWALLACAWRRLSAALVPGFLFSVLSAALFVALNERLQMAGEWIVGGVEAKGFAYALVLFGMSSLVRDRWGTAIVLLGGASAMHVVVGGWAMVALAIAWLTGSRRPPLRQLALPLAAGFALALFGLGPAVALTWGADPALVRHANHLYVYERLYHHLLPERFPPWFLVRHVGLVLVLAALVAWGPRDARFGRLYRFVAAAIGIAVVGLLLSLLAPLAPDFTAAVLRYYWFRLTDVMAPLGAALVATAIVARWSVAWPRQYALGLAALVIVAGGHLGDVVGRRYLDPFPPADATAVNLDGWRRHYDWAHDDAGLPDEEFAELRRWREICQWAQQETPPDTVFIVPRLAQTFRWYAGRAEVVNRKDIPQDAAGIVEWWRRNQLLYGADPDSGSAWLDSLTDLGAERLRELGAEFGADYAITSAVPPLALERVGPINTSFAVYRLRSAAQ
jgi:hypothetical protein